MFDRTRFCVSRRALSALAFGFSVASASLAMAGPLPTGMGSGCTLLPTCTVTYWDSEDGGNDHYYGYVPLAANTSWTSASATAQGSTLGGASVGYLTTLTSAEEQAFVQTQVLPAGSTKSQVWIGGRQLETLEDVQPAPAAGWEWIMPHASLAPESWDYTNWSPDEPNDEVVGTNANERFLTMWVHLNKVVEGQVVNVRGAWNDSYDIANANAPAIGMIIEWEHAPEPGTVGLVALGVGLLALRRRRSC